MTYLTFKYTVTLKPGLGVTQGHRNRHESIRRLRRPINVPQQPWAYLVQFPRKTAISVENRKFFPPSCILHPFGIGYRRL